MSCSHTRTHSFSHPRADNVVLNEEEFTKLACLHRAATALCAQLGLPVHHPAVSQ
jgi:hypothetical protein